MLEHIKEILKQVNMFLYYLSHPSFFFIESDF
jgi:hypothetical protein